MRIVKVRNIEFGIGRPKIAVPITGKSSDDIVKQAETIISSNNADLIEWRIDFFDQVEDAEKLVETAKKLRQVMSEMPLLTTFRTHFEGGVKKLSEEEYFDICRVLIKEKATDLLDLELFRKTSKLKEIIAEAHENNIYIIMSNHDFDKTPATSELERRLTLMKTYGADIAKIAVMPNSARDVLNLLLATDNIKYKLNCPLITMAMGDIGKVTRISGEDFGSCLTFGTVGDASAPGQIESTNLKGILDTLKIE
ncbi:type I 3-dehydroquinate dehydratase [Ligilactobacillus salivarius]|uniref:type I 3-dehydroquinate dehydratase n=1 Tax=Ligilactobacillus salivarius TaxID=1624 RepID=UPI0020235072|nr:type I 3-dehydroquinate dehydratase [Ligilactobacillus salivarius]URI13790.1 type I 3-dehydroquinate dehydratase [Ligilactobacillus salivarius]UUB35565.1 type I 3-dehydroquinate dehydratase [Ligilactobacillus salivarius]